MMGQGANIGSYSAFVLADAIAESYTFDLAFCQEVDRSRSARILGASSWTNAFLQPPDEAKMELLEAMSRNQQLADEYYENFNQPEMQWQRLHSAKSIRNWLAEHEVRATNPELAMAAE
jgi:hypothetical protein